MEINNKSENDCSEYNRCSECAKENIIAKLDELARITNQLDTLSKSEWKAELIELIIRREIRLRENLEKMKL